MPKDLKSRAPHLLTGGTLRNWAALVARNGVAPRSLGRAAKITAGVTLLGPLRAYESLRYRGRVDAVRLDPAPVFIIGHWQAGHSPVHQLLACDPQFAVVTLLHCVLPANFLTMKKPIARFLKKRLPKDRLVDSLPVGPRAPQGDDMAMAGLTDLSFYHAYCFPRTAERTFRRGVLLDGLSEREIDRWADTYVRFMQRVALDTGRNRLLLRNASNTGRIPHLLRRFPEARFIHVYRDPYRIYSALRQRWHGLLSAWALHEYDLDAMQEHSLDFFERLMRRYLEDRGRIPPGRLAEVRYEDFEADPLAVAEDTYRRLGLTGFDAAREPMRAYLATTSGSLGGGDVDLSPEQAERVTRRWGFALDEWVYPRLHAVARPA